MVITNGTSESFELRRDDAKSAVVVDPGGSTTVKVSEGEPINLSGTVIQVY